ncbi:thiol reductant ABC exporter subunit CydC [Cryptobacterium curtum]
MFDKRLFELAPEARIPVLVSVVLKIVALFANIAMMIALGRAVEGIFRGTSTLLDSETLALVAVALIVRAVAGYGAQRAGDRAAVAAKKSIRTKIYNKLVSLGPAYQETVSTSEAVQLAVEGSEQLEVYFGGYVPQLFFSLIAPIILFICLLPIAAGPACMLLACVIFIPALIIIVRRKATAVAEDYWDTYTDLGSMFLEDLQGMTTLKIFQADKMRHQQMNDTAEGFRKATMRMLGVQLTSIGAMDVVAYGGAAAGIVVTLVLLFQGSLSFAAAFAVVFLSQEFFLPMRALGSLFHAAISGMASSVRIFELLDTKETPRKDAKLTAQQCELSCRTVGYTYPGSSATPTLHSIDLDFPANSFTGIVGKSGAGKSTLAAVLSGHADAYTGTVAINGVELHNLSASTLATLVTVVPSDGMLFAGSIRENLQMAAPCATDTAMEDALERCGILDFVRTAGGLDLVLSEGGSNLSGGQRQRIALARALLHDTPIYVFDEATSSIDAESEKAISEVIRSMKGDRTVIVIAHRLSLVKDANNIVVLDGGTVTEEGSHAELVQTGGLFAQLWESQRHLEERAAAAEAANSNVASASRTVAASTDRASSATAHKTPAQPESPESNISTSARSAASSTHQPTQATHQPDRATSINQAATPKRSNFAIMRRLIKLVRPLAPRMALAITLGTIGFLAAIFLMAFASYGIVEGTLGTGSSLSLLCVAAVACGILRGPLRYGEQLCNHDIAFRILAYIRDVLYGALRRLAPAKLEGRAKGDLVSVATGDIELLEVFYAHTISPIAIACIVSVIMLAFFGATVPEVVPLAFASYLLVGVVLPIFASHISGRAGEHLREGQGRLESFTLESLRGMRELLQFGHTQERGNTLTQITNELCKVELSLKARSAAMEAATQAIVGALAIGMVQFAFALAASGTTELGAAFVVGFTFMSSFGPVLALMRLGTTLQQTFASGGRVLDILDEAPETPEIEDGSTIEFSSAEFDGVSFSYAGAQKQVLDQVSFVIPQGKAIALVGENGCGKSTTLKLLMRFWDACSGAVRISGHDVREVHTASLRSNEGYLTQDTHLFAGTIGENIRLAKTDATDDQLRAACAKASVLTLIDSLPSGFDTPAGELGGRLSGGERQRIGLARIFLQDAPFLLLDEPTSNIDALNEAAIVEALESEKTRKTIVLVSHRASTRALADTEISLDRSTSTSGA